MGQAKSGTWRILQTMTVCGSRWPMSTYSGSHEADNRELFLANNVLEYAMVGSLGLCTCVDRAVSRLCIEAAK